MQHRFRVARFDGHRLTFTPINELTRPGRVRWLARVDGWEVDAYPDFYASSMDQLITYAMSDYYLEVMKGNIPKCEKIAFNSLGWRL